MIRFLEGELLPQWEAACRLEPVFGGKLETLLAVYGVGSLHCGFWVVLDGDGLPVGGVAREGDTFTLALSPLADAEELAQFLAAIGGSRAEGREPFLTALAKGLGGAGHRSPLLAYRGSSPPFAPLAVEADHLTAVYRLLCAADPSFVGSAPYEPWLCGFFARVRAGRASAFLCGEGGKPVSTASVYHLGAGYGMLGSVATLPEYRGKGYASQAVLAAVAWVLRRGAVPVLLPAGEELLPFYTRLGFAPLGEAGQFFLPQQNNLEET